MLLGLALAAGCGGTAQPTGLVALGSETHDFGKRPQRDVLTHTFELVNRAGAPVKIDGLSSSCTCLVADDLGPTTVAPGGRFLVPIHFTTGAAQETASGRVDVVYHLLDGADTESDHPRSVSLLVRADVLPEYRILPREIDFGVIDGLAVERVQRTFRIVPEAADEVHVQDVTCANPFLTARLLPRPPDDATTQIEVVLDVSGLARSRPIDGTIIVTTDNKTLPKAIVRVRAEYQAPAQADPDMIVIGSNERGDVEREIRLTTTRPSRIQDLRCSANADQIRVEHNGEQTAEEHVLRLFVVPCSGASLDCELELDLKLFTGNGEPVVRTVKVPVHRLPHEGELS